MSDYEIDHEAIRARVEKRLQPRMKLLRRRAWLFAHIAMFAAAILMMYGPGATSLLFAFSTSYTQPGWTYLNGSTGQYETVPDTTYISWRQYPWVDALTIIWILILIVHCANIWMQFSRERMIQREINREIELEKMRLEIELARARGLQTENDDVLEKPKRAVSLSDEGELVYDESAPEWKRQSTRRTT